MSLPNLITIVRILLTPLFVIFVLNGRRQEAAIVFVIAAVSDALDGFIARVFRQKTVLGSYLDPIADKLLLSTSYIVLAVTGLLPDWLAITVISRDVIILLGVAVFFIVFQPFTIRPTLLSKLTTCSQIITLLVVLFGPEALGLRLATQPLFLATAALTVASGLHYIYIGINVIAKHEPQVG